jgi:hypothetical protein
VVERIVNIRRSVTLFAFLVMWGILLAESKTSHRAEQLHFSAESSAVKYPVAISEDMMAILRKDEMVRNVAENENIRAEKIPVSWFSASAIHLNGPLEMDFVVMAGDALGGGNTSTFWVFRAIGRRYELILTAPAHDLTIRNTRWKGYRDIELTSMSAVRISHVLCRFDGERYSKYKIRSEEIR